MSEALRIQFDPWKCNYFARVKNEIEKSCSEVKCELSEEKDPDCVNLDCFVESKAQLRKLWRRTKSEIKKDELFASAIIVTCTDEGSWANYLLLHHRNSKEETDRL